MTDICSLAASLRDPRAESPGSDVAYASRVHVGADALFDARCAGVAGMEAPDHVASVIAKICDAGAPEAISDRSVSRGAFAGMDGLRGLPHVAERNGGAHCRGTRTVMPEPACALHGCPRGAHGTRAAVCVKR